MSSFHPCHRLRFAATALALILLGGTSARANLLANGSFENINANPLVLPHAYLDFSSTATPDLVPGWIAASPYTISWMQDVIPFGGFAISPQDGLGYIDLTGPSDNGYGALNQTFSTVAGTQYDLTFWGGAWPFSNLGAAAQTLTATLSSGTGTFASFDASVPVCGITTAACWTSYQFSFIAAGASTTLSFTGSAPVQQTFLGLDNVSVTAISPVPEPGTLSMTMAGLLAAGLTLRRRVALI